MNNCDSNSSQVELKQRLDSDTNGARIKSQPVILCGYWLLNEVVGWLRKVEKDWEVHCQGFIPAFGGETWENDKVRGLPLVQPIFELGKIVSLNYLGTMSWVEIYSWDKR